jgi:hypothetical protein
LRPSPPHSVASSIDGPEGRRNWATSMSRWPGEIFVKNAGAQLRAACELRAEVLDRLALGREDEGLFSSRLPGPGLARQPGDARIGRQPALREPPQRGLVPRNLREEGRPRGQGGTQQPRLVAPCDRVRSRTRAQRALERRQVVPARIRGRSTGRATAREPADVGPTRRAGGRERLTLRQSFLEPLARRNLVGAQELEKAEEPVRVVLERRGGESSVCRSARRSARWPGIRGYPGARAGAGDGGPRRRSGGRSR